MVEDDDNYWDNVIEFGDGRQYKVEMVQQTSSRSREPSPPSSVKSSRSVKPESADVPVSKAERFADDFDRSWPRCVFHQLVDRGVKHANFIVARGAVHRPVYSSDHHRSLQKFYLTNVRIS
jgi:serine/arginine repetitive matrix protein 2